MITTPTAKQAGYRPTVQTHRNAVAEVRIVDQRTVIRYSLYPSKVVGPPEEYPTAGEAIVASFEWLRGEQHRYNLEH